MACHEAHDQLVVEKNWAAFRRKGRRGKRGVVRWQGVVEIVG